MKTVNTKVWTCKIVVDAEELPDEFDSPPRMAAEGAIEDAGFKVLMNSSGWGGKLNKHDIEYLKENDYDTKNAIYYAGLADTEEDIEH